MGLGQIGADDWGRWFNPMTLCVIYDSPVTLPFLIICPIFFFGCEIHSVFGADDSDIGWICRRPLGADCIFGEMWDLSVLLSQNPLPI